MFRICFCRISFFSMGFFPIRNYIINENTPLVNSNLPCFGLSLLFTVYLRRFGRDFAFSHKSVYTSLQAYHSLARTKLYLSRDHVVLARSYKRSERRRERSVFICHNSPRTYGSGNKPLRYNSAQRHGKLGSYLCLERRIERVNNSCHSSGHA